MQDTFLIKQVRTTSLFLWKYFEFGAFADADLSNVEQVLKIFR